MPSSSKDAFNASGGDSRAPAAAVHVPSPNSKVNSDKQDQAAVQARPATRCDVFWALKAVEFPGSPCTGGGPCKELPPTTLKVGVGTSDKVTEFSLPINELQIGALRGLASPLATTSTGQSSSDNIESRNMLEIPGRNLQLTNPEFEGAIDQLCREAAAKLGLSPHDAAPRLEKLLLFQAGSYLKIGSETHSSRELDGGDDNDAESDADVDADAEISKDAIGSLIVQLPSTFTGGAIEMSHNEDVGPSVSFDLGSGGSAAYNCHFTACYADSNVKFKPIDSGHRLALLYSLHYLKGVSRRKAVRPSAKQVIDSVRPLRQCLSSLPRCDRMFLVPLRHPYDAKDLIGKGVKALIGKDRGNAEAILAAGNSTGHQMEGDEPTAEWSISIAQVVREVQSHRYKEDEVRITLSKAYDADGNEVCVVERVWVDGWSLFDYDSCNVSSKGMVLSGKSGGISETSSSSVDLANDESTWGYSETEQVDIYNYGPKDTYNRSFLVVTDKTSEFEFRCLEGQNDINDVIKDIHKAPGLLPRFMSALKRLEERSLTEVSCVRLMRLVVDASTLTSTEKSDFTSSIVRSMRDEEEPSLDFFDLIVTGADPEFSFKLVSCISRLLSHKKGRTVLSLEQIQRRSLFALRLDQRFRENGRSSASTASATSLCCRAFEDLAVHYAKEPAKDSEIDYSSCMDSTVLSLESMIDEFGWDTSRQVVLSTLGAVRAFQMQREIPFDLTESLSQALTKRATLIKGINDTYCNAGVEDEKIKHCLLLALQDITTKLPSFSQTGCTTLLLSGKRESMLQLILELGSNKAKGNIGKWVGSDRSDNSSRLTTLVDAMMVVSSKYSTTNSIARKIFVDCLLQPKGWALNGNGCVCSASTLRAFIDMFPSAVTEKSDEGRLAIHHAIEQRFPRDVIECICDSYPSGVSVPDPETDLFPFMVAGLKRDIDSAYTLLRLDPSLVTGTKGEEVPRSKKKRRLSSTTLATIPARKASKPSYRLGETQYRFGSNANQQALNQASYKDECEEKDENCCIM